MYVVQLKHRRFVNGCENWYLKKRPERKIDKWDKTFLGNFQDVHYIIIKIK